MLSLSKWVDCLISTHQKVRAYLQLYLYMLNGMNISNTT